MARGQTTAVESILYGDFSRYSLTSTGVSARHRYCFRDYQGWQGCEDWVSFAESVLDEVIFPGKVQRAGAPEPDEKELIHAIGEELTPLTKIRADEVTPNPDYIRITPVTSSFEQPAAASLWVRAQDMAEVQNIYSDLQVEWRWSPLLPRVVLLMETDSGDKLAALRSVNPPWNTADE